jgi:hypothetical protein
MNIDLKYSQHDVKNIAVRVRCPSIKLPSALVHGGRLCCPAKCAFSELSHSNIQPIQLTLTVWTVSSSNVNSFNCTDIQPYLILMRLDVVVISCDYFSSSLFLKRSYNPAPLMHSCMVQHQLITNALSNVQLV